MTSLWQIKTVLQSDQTAFSFGWLTAHTQEEAMQMAKGMDADLIEAKTHDWPGPPGVIIWLQGEQPQEPV